MFECGTTSNFSLRLSDNDCIHFQVVVEISDGHTDIIQQVVLGSVSIYDCPYYGGEGTIGNWSIISELLRYAIRCKFKVEL